MCLEKIVFDKRRNFEMGLSTQQRLGQNLKILRASKDVNQNEMAEYIGLTRSSYAQYELGNRTPDAHTLYAIAKFYKISIDLLFEPDLSCPNSKLELLPLACFLQVIAPHRQTYYLIDPLHLNVVQSQSLNQPSKVFQLLD